MVWCEQWKLFWYVGIPCWHPSQVSPSPTNRLKTTCNKLTWSEVVWMDPWFEKLGLIGTWPITGTCCCCCWFITGTDADLWSNPLCISVCCWTPTLCCLGEFQAGGIWLAAGGVGVLGILCWPEEILCTGGWGLAAIGCWEAAGESVRLFTGKGLALLLIPARTYCTFTPDCTLRSWPSGKAILHRKRVAVAGIKWH